MCPRSDKISETDVAESTHGGITNMEQSPSSSAASSSARQGISSILTELIKGEYLVKNTTDIRIDIILYD